MEGADGESVWEPSSNSSCADFSGAMHNQHVEQPATDDEDRHQFSCTDGDVQPILDDAKRDQTPLFIELCAGCGILSATVAALGFDVMAVDHTHNRHQTRVKMFNLDLSREHSWVVLRHIARECRIIAVHIAPPCGTCSRAREIKLSSSWHGPQPLRNEVYPYGVPWMSAKDAERVDSANNLYKHMAEFCEFLEEISIAWTIENPTNSWLWALPCMQKLVQRFFFANFHSCAYGGQRYKATSFLTNHAGFLILCRQCDNSHIHLEWGYDSSTNKFSTALEAEYPKGLCEEYAQVLLEVARVQKIHVTPFKPKLHPQKQRSGRTVPPLVPEYVKVTTALLTNEPALDGKQRLIHNLGNIPAGSKLLRTEANRGMMEDKDQTLYVFGIYHGHMQFVEVARSLWHPYDELRHIPDLMIISIYNLLSCSRIATARSRLQTLQQWREWAKELCESEKRVKDQMPQQARRIMQNKRLALLQKIACECLDWPDEAIHSDLQVGFRLVGEAPATGIFRVQPKTASLSEDDLMLHSKFHRPAIVGKTRSAGAGPHLEALFETTVKEARDKHWLDGPHTQEEIDRMFSGQWLPVRRFGVEQRGKLRPIDDFCENQLNNAFTTVDKISLRTLDHILWAALIICRHCLFDKTMSFVLKDGRQLAGPVHSDWHECSGMKITALDLKSAYKQLPLHQRDVNKAVVTILNPTTGDPQFFTMNTLPFGASASVLHFNRVSNLLWAIGCKLGLIWSSYYDDFPLLCPSGLEQSSLGAAKAMFNLLGFEYAEDKLSEPSEKTEILGIELDTADSKSGTLRVGNKRDRINEIEDTLNKILRDGRIRPRELPSHLGRLQFAEMQISGRAGRLAMHDLRLLGTSDNSFHDLNETAVSALRLLKRRLTSGKPKTLQAKAVAKPWLLFTDGALEYDENGKSVATIGAVLLPPKGVAKYFGCKVPREAVELWQTEGKEHVIGLVELYASIVALRKWCNELKGNRLILFIDNYGAQDCLIKGAASVETWRKLLLLLEDIDYDFFSEMWVTRVPSSSNPADFPSRSSVGELAHLEPLERCQPTCPLTGCCLETIC